MTDWKAIRDAMNAANNHPGPATDEDFTQLAFVAIPEMLALLVEAREMLVSAMRYDMTKPPLDKAAARDLIARLP